MKILKGSCYISFADLILLKNITYKYCETVPGSDYLPLYKNIVHIRICDKYFLAIVMRNDLLKCFLRKNNSIQEDLIELALNYLIKMSTLLTYGISDSSEQTKLISLSISKLNPLIVLWYYIPVRVGVMEQHESQHFLTFLSLARLQKAQHCLLY
ncbi:hypothetical protein T4B_9488 [Trichinella pseudospiralis]|uniref:Uncharacterized protein n=1 Tax=Trichinella pseudospiralis TaxID=6337 RepID=A0A0V1J9F5_TRIPS|nr:hypothetical protein T4B_9488 [Trichinella pseudospiralis]